LSGKPASLPLFADAYLADTTHLSTEEHGAYLLLMMAAWRQADCALPDDDRKLARIAGLSTKKWASIKPTIMEFWQVEGGRIHQRRLRKEHEWVAQKSAHNRAAAEARWAAQDIENKQPEPCERISECNAPPPPPPKEELVAKATCASDDAPTLKPVHVLEAWNETAKKVGKPQARDLTPARSDLLKARIAQYDLDDFLNVFGKIEMSPFLRGDTGWRGGNFDWVFKRANFQKILEGNYDG
jgi:uncharacterized protein YdaU (DUF1376 family)